MGMYNNKKYIEGILYCSLLVIVPTESYSEQIFHNETIHFFANGMPKELRNSPQTLIRKEEGKIYKNIRFDNDYIGREWSNLKINYDTNLEKEIGVTINHEINKVKIFKDKDDLVKIFLRLNVIKNNESMTEYVVCPVEESHTSRELWMVKDPKTGSPIKFYKNRKLSPIKVLEPGYYFSSASKDLIKKPIVLSEQRAVTTREDVYASELNLICSKVNFTINADRLNNYSERRFLKWNGLQNIDN